MKQGFLVVLFFIVPFVCFSQTAEDFYNSGNNHVQNQEYTEAIVAYTKSINQYANFIDSYFMLLIAFLFLVLRIFFGLSLFKL